MASHTLDGLLVVDPVALLVDLRPSQRPGVLISPRGERLSGRARRPRTSATAAVGAGDRHEATMLAGDRLGRALAFLAGFDDRGRF